MYVQYKAIIIVYYMANFFGRVRRKGKKIKDAHILILYG